MSDRLLVTAAVCEDLSGVDGDGLGEEEVAFEGEERCWEDWPLQLLLSFDLAREARADQGPLDQSPRRAAVFAQGRL